MSSSLTSFPPQQPLKVTTPLGLCTSSWGANSTAQHQAEGKQRSLLSPRISLVQSWATQGCPFRVTNYTWRHPTAEGNQTYKDPGIVSSLLGPPTTIFKDVKSGDTEHYRNTWIHSLGRLWRGEWVSPALKLGLARRGGRQTHDPLDLEPLFLILDILW